MMMSHARYLPILLLAVHAATTPIAAQSALQVRDSLPEVVDPAADGVRRQHTFDTGMGQRVDVRVTSELFDTVLEVISPAGDTLHNDDFGGTTNSRIVTIATVRGVWTAVVTSFDGRGGEYALDVSVGLQADAGRALSGALTSVDSVSAKGEIYEVHTVRLDRSTQLLIEMAATDFEPRLVVFSPDDRRFASGFTSFDSPATVEISRAEPGEWRIVATHASWSEPVGSYTIQLYESPVSGGVQARSNSLRDSDPMQIGGEYYHTYTVRLPQGERLTLDLSSTSFDAYLAVRSPSGQWFRDDDGGDGSDARLELEPETGDWRVIVTSFSAESTGAYSLTLACENCVVTP